MHELNKAEFETYLQCLRTVAELPTVFTQPEQVEKAMCWCHSFFKKQLSGYRIYRDRKRNLIAIPLDIDPGRDIIYLSAHIDTVDADASEWDEPFSPFSLYEDDRQMVARGISDCKAGVALELFVPQLAQMQKRTLSNLIFTITFHEEGSGEKSSMEIGQELGKTLPISNKDTFFLVLENTVTVSNPPVLSYYTVERGNFVIRISETLPRLRELLSRLPKWNPVSIQPENIQEIEKSTQVFTQKGGHVCSVPRESNLLTQVIMEASDNDILKAGDEDGFSVIPSTILKRAGQASTVNSIIHHLLLSNRSFDTLEDVQSQLENVTYEAVKDFSISQGMNFSSQFSKHPLLSFLRGHEKQIVVSESYNTGVSDATIVSSSMDAHLKDRFYPIVMGPGTRSQRNVSLPRLTHGKNETFDKQSGKLAVEYILSVLTQLGTF